VRKVRLLTKPAFHEEDSEGSWAVSYGDMITLLLSFFVIYFTTEPGREKLEQQNSMLALDLEATSVQAALRTDQTLSQTLPKLEESQDAQIKVSQIGQQMVITFGMNSFFSSGNTDVTEKGAKLLKLFADRYLPYASNYRLSLKAFTDSRPVKSKRQRRFQDNLELSALRSITAMRELQRAGIPLEKMELAGAGELKTMSKALPNAKELTKQELDSLSRTVVLVISPEKEGWP
jgi:flagellar motor protein MotB